MSLLKKMKNKKLNAVVYASIMAFGISGNVEATSYPPLFSGPVYNEGFALPSGGDFSGYYDWPNLVEILISASSSLLAFVVKYVMALLKTVIFIIPLPIRNFGDIPLKAVRCI